MKGLIKTKLYVELLRGVHHFNLISVPRGLKVYLGSGEYIRGGKFIDYELGDKYPSKEAFIENLIEGKASLIKEVFGLSTGTLGSRIKKRRLNRGLSQKKLSKVIGVDQTLITKIERGERTPPPRLLEFLNIEKTQV